MYWVMWCVLNYADDLDLELRLERYETLMDRRPLLLSRWVWPVLSYGQLYVSKWHPLIPRVELSLKWIYLPPSSVLLRQNPHNVHEWHKRVALFEGKPREVRMVSSPPFILPPPLTSASCSTSSPSHHLCPRSLTPILRQSKQWTSIRQWAGHTPSGWTLPSSTKPTTSWQRLDGCGTVA